MELDLGVPRSTLALAGALTWVGTGLGGIVMGWLSDRIGIRVSVLIGTVMIALGPCVMFAWQHLGALCRPGPSYWISGDGRGLSAAVHLCQSLV